MNAIKTTKANWSAVTLAVLLMQACGGGGGGESSTAVSNADAAVSPAPAAPAPAAPAPAPAPTVVDLRDEKVALRLASAMIEATSASVRVPGTRWDGRLFRVRSRTDISGCNTGTTTNADGIPGVGDKIELRSVNCTIGVTNGNWVTNQQGLLTLTAISNPQLPQFGAWTATEDGTTTGSISWDVPVTVSAYQFKGQSNFSNSYTLQVTHNADGSQQDARSANRVTAKGSDSLGAFDFVIDASRSCSFAVSLSSAGVCSNGTVRLTGTLAGLSADSTMTQTKTSPPEFAIRQGAQQITVSFNPQASSYIVTTTGGIALTTTVLDLISGY